MIERIEYRERSAPQRQREREKGEGDGNKNHLVDELCISLPSVDQILPIFLDFSSPSVALN